MEVGKEPEPVKMFRFDSGPESALPALRITPDNPAPDGGGSSVVRTRDGVRLRVATWRVPRPRGTVLLMQGRAEFIEKYFETIGELLARGLSVVTFDWRGQGGSGRALRDPHRGHVGRFDEFRLDVEAVLAQAVAPLADGPVSGVAHSMGGCIALIGARQGWLPVERLVALTPMIGLSLVRQPRPARALAGLLRRLGLGARYVPGGTARSISTLPFPGNRLCADRGRYDRNAALAEAIGAGAIGSPTIGWLAAAYEAMALFGEPGFAGGIDIPVLLLAAGAYPVCSTPAIERFALGLRHGRLATIPDARHEILMETGPIRGQFWAAFDEFMDEGAAQPAGRAALTG